MKVELFFSQTLAIFLTHTLHARSIHSFFTEYNHLFNEFRNVACQETKLVLDGKKCVTGQIHPQLCYQIPKQEEVK